MHAVTRRSDHQGLALSPFARMLESTLYQAAHTSISASPIFSVVDFTVLM
jgi:hypothetical protein